MSDWISVEDRLPEDGQRVLIFTPCTNCYGRDWKPIHQNTADFCKGRTAEEIRRNGGLHCADDEKDNNKRPYAWRDGAMHWWGQEVTHWMPLPAPPLQK